MSEFIKVAKLSEVPPHTARCIEANGQRIGLYNLDGTIYALDDTCTHAEASLCGGPVHNGEIACPLHFATFDIRTGKCTGPPADEDLKTYRVRINGEDVEVEL